MARLLLLFIIVPVAEVVIYIKLGQVVGLWATLALIFGTGIAGAFLARTQGFQIIQQVRYEIAQGRIPGNEMVDGALVLAGGLLLLTPGLLTDVTGFLLLLPPTRKLIRELLKKKIRKWVDNGQIYFYFDRK
ncbi:MAG: membrane protein FxsA [Actinobacteria bacterium]|nr:MAG: membrane protein FxsA [Actinomycetota bacterium]